MQIPKSAKIGGIVYKVIVAEEWPGRAKGEHDGECFYDQEHGNTIYIGAELSQEAQMTALRLTLTGLRESG